MYRFLRDLSIALILCFFTAHHSNAQDYNFSQFWENRTYYNPAFVGLKMGEWHNNLSYRKLWPGLDGDFSTIFFSSDLKTYNNYGLGFSFASSDEAGFIKTTAVTLSYSWRGYIAKEKNIFFQLGIRGGFHHEKLDRNKWIFSGQLDAIYGNIYPNHTGIDVVKLKQNYWDFSTGAMVSLPVLLYNNNTMENYLGISVSHFTRPKDNFIEEDARIPVKISFQWHSQIPTSIYSLDKKSKLEIKPGIIFENQGEKLLSKTSFNNSILGLDINTDPLVGGIWYSSQLLSKSDQNYKALIFKLGLKFNSNNKVLQYRINYSYDMSLGNLVKSTEGSHEIGISLIYRFDPRHNYNIFSF